MDITSKSIKMIIKTQILSVICVIVGRLHISLLLAYRSLFTNSIILSLSFISFAVFCIIISMLLLNGNLLNIILVSVSYIVYLFLFGTKIFLFHSNTDPNDFGFGFMGLLTEIFIGLFQYIIVIISSILSTSIHKTNNALKNKDC